MPTPIEEVIAELGNGDKPLLNSRLIYLSNLNPAEMTLFEQAWATIELKRREQIISRLVELAEDSFDLNFDSILKYCLKDKDAEVRSKAIEGLWESEEISLVNPLINLLERDSSEKVQVAAVTALGKFALLVELKKLRSCHVAKISQALLAVISDVGKPLEVRRRALEAVSPLSIPEVTAAITQAYHSNNAKLRASAIYAMGKSCNYSWLPILLQELGNAEAEIRYEAAGACGEFGEREAVPYLIELTRDPDTNVQLAAIQALGKIGGKDAKEWLKRCLRHPENAVSEAAERALNEMEAEEEPLLFWRISD